MDPICHFPDDSLQLDHGHVGGLVVGVRGVVAPQEACRKQHALNEKWGGRTEYRIIDEALGSIRT